MSMREKIIEAGVKWADEYDSSDPLQISKLADAIIAALREQKPVGEVQTMTGNGKIFAPYRAAVWVDGMLPPDGTGLYALPLPPVKQSGSKRIAELEEAREDLKRIGEALRLVKSQECQGHYADMIRHIIAVHEQTRQGLDARKAQIAIMAPLVQHADDCAWLTPLMTGEGHCGCSCGHDRVVLDGEALDPLPLLANDQQEGGE